MLVNNISKNQYYFFLFIKSTMASKPQKPFLEAFSFSLKNRKMLLVFVIFILLIFWNELAGFLAGRKKQGKIRTFGGEVFELFDGDSPGVIKIELFHQSLGSCDDVILDEN